MKSIRQQKKRVIFWQDWGIFFGYTMVTVGFNDYEDIKKFLKKKKYNEWLDALNIKLDEFDTHHASVWENNGKHYSLLFLVDYKDDFEYHKILAHEILHLISFRMTDFLDPLKENEAFTYTHSYLMQNIRDKIIK